MIWRYEQATGRLYYGPTATHLATGYSGQPGYTDETLVDLGPIPRGRWKMGPAYDHPHLGPCTINLEPVAGTNTLGRVDFRIHGDSFTHPGHASNGCIALALFAREAIAASGDTVLEVF